MRPSERRAASGATAADSSEREAVPTPGSRSRPSGTNPPAKRPAGSSADAEGRGEALPPAPAAGRDDAPRASSDGRDGAADGQRAPAPAAADGTPADRNGRER